MYRHVLEGTIHANHADLVDETNVKDIHLKNAPEYSQAAISLSPNPVKYAHLCKYSFQVTGR